jgi:hypothetical protein
MQPPGRTYGRLNYKDASTTDLMNWEPTSELLAMMRDKQESIYASTKAEPLGRSMERGHVLPAHMTGDKFAFGKPGDRGNGGSKEALFPAVSHPRVPGVAPIDCCLLGAGFSPVHRCDAAGRNGGRGRRGARLISEEPR